MLDYRNMATSDIIEQWSSLYRRSFIKDTVNLSRKLSATIAIENIHNSVISESIDIKLNDTIFSQYALNSHDIMKPEKKLSREIPTFREFSLFVAKKILSCAGDPACLNLIDVHIQPQVTRCNPCAISFDAIIKVSSVVCSML